MATLGASSSAHLAHKRRVRACLRTLQTPGSEQALQPLATHLSAQRLVRAPGYAGAPLRHLDLEVLRTALSRLLNRDTDDGYLVYQLVVEGAEPAQVAAERGVSRPALVEMLRDAVGALAGQYEHLAHGHLGDAPAVRLRAALGGKTPK